MVHCYATNGDDAKGEKRGGKVGKKKIEERESVDPRDGDRHG